MSYVGTEGNDLWRGGAKGQDANGMGGDDTLIGGTAADSLFGGYGSDLVSGGDGADLIGDFDGNDTLSGGAGDDRIYDSGTSDDVIAGEGGNDDLDGGYGRDSISGGTGNDVIRWNNTGEPGDQATLNGGAGADTIFAGFAANIDGGAGLDTIYLIDAGAQAALSVDFGAAGPSSFGSVMTGIEQYGVLWATHQDDFISVGSLRELDHPTEPYLPYNELGIRGLAGNDTIVAGAGTNHLYGNAGEDVLRGGDGDDFLDGGGAEFDTLDGGAGSDSVDYSYRDIGAPLTGIRIDLNKTGRQSNGDTLISIENVRATGGDDTLTGNGKNNILGGMGGFDVIDGRGGFDIVEIFGNTAIDLTRSSMQKDDAGTSGVRLKSIEGLIGDDWHQRFTGTKRANLLDGGGGDDLLKGGAGADTLIGGFGTDTLIGGTGADVIDGGDNRDLILIKALGDAKGDVIDGGTGWDILQIDKAPGKVADLRSIGISGIEGVRAKGMAVIASADQFPVLGMIDAASLTFTNAGKIRFATEEHGWENAADFVLSVGTITLADGRNTFDMRGATLFEGSGVGEVRGGRGRDMIYGSEMSEKLLGGGGNDTLVGGDGQDTLDGGAGADLMRGGGTDDTYFVDSSKDRIEDSGGDDTAMISADFRLHAAIENVVLTKAVTVHGSDYRETITGAAGNDTIYGEGGDDTAYGGTGDDRLYGGGGNNFLDGGDGNDLVSVAGQRGWNILDGGVGNDTLVGGNGADQISGGFGSDVMTGGGGADTFYFNQFSTTIVDEVTDYDFAAGDVLNFSALYDQAIAAGVTSIDYLAGGAFKGHKGEARIELHDGYGLFQFDLNGDKVSDLTIRLDGVVDTSSVLFVLA